MLPIEKEIFDVMSQIFKVSSDLLNETISVHTLSTWDSMHHMELMVALERKFGIQLSDDEIVTLVSFNKIRDAIFSRRAKE